MSETMLAVVKPEAAPGADIRQMPRPKFGPDDVLVKVKVASICGTDLHIYNWDQWAQNRIKPPLIPGHEFCGNVEAVGNEVTAVKEGDFVSAEMHVACGKCFQCRTGEAHICQHVKIIGVDANGAFAEYVTFLNQTSGRSILRIPARLRQRARSAGQRGPYSAGRRDRRQDRGGHRLRADRAVLHRGGPRLSAPAQVFALEVNEHRRKLAQKMKADSRARSGQRQCLRERDGATGGTAWT